jgi:outer membrane receptor protein involved in Fe transport
MVSTSEWKKWSLSPIWQLRSGRSDGYGPLPSWDTFDIRLSKSVSIRKVGVLSVNAVARNLFDERYETVSGYPMPGRNFTIGVELKF